MWQHAIDMLIKSPAPAPVEPPRELFRTGNEKFIDYLRMHGEVDTSRIAADIGISRCTINQRLTKLAERGIVNKRLERTTVAKNKIVYVAYWRVI